MYETLNMKPERTEGIAAFAEKRAAAVLLTVYGARPHNSI